MRKAGTALVVATLAMISFGAAAANSDPQFVGQGTGREDAAGQVFDWFDPEGEILSSVEPELAERLIDRVRQETRRTESHTQAMLESLIAVTSEIRQMSQRGELAGKSRPAIGAISVIAVLDTLVEIYPELGSRVLENAQSTRAGGSPIERMCSCDRGGSRACGCSVRSTGSGSCEYSVSCRGFRSAACSAANFEMCIIREVLALL